jgi:DNA-binding beta-propeller fold protein YncE
MLKHETKLIDPAPEETAAAISEATADANKRCRSRLLKDDPAKWRKFARNAAASPEGYSMFRGGKGGVPATQVLAAWWTDSIGRKHVVVRGRRVEHDEAKRLLHKEDLEKRPPLWHAYPEYVCRRTVGKESQVVCACGCGAVGTPEALGWMGETCGPCADRKEELGDAGLVGNVPGVLYSDREPLGAVACSPDGGRVAAVEGRNFATYWDIPRRTRTVVKFSGRTVTGVAITSDAKYLLVTGVGLADGIGLFAAFDLGADPPARVAPTLETDPPGWGIEAMPDPGLALTHRGNPAVIPWRAEVVRVPSGEAVSTVVLPHSMPAPLAVSPDGSAFAYSGDSIGVVRIGTREPVWNVNWHAKAVAFSQDAKRLFVVGHNTVAARDAASGRPLAAAADGGRRFGGEYGYITALAADPGGEFVYAATFGGTLLAFDANSLALRATFDWHLGGIRGLAVSADGSRLFSSGTDGCVKVWPIRNLLRGL